MLIHSSECKKKHEEDVRNNLNKKMKRIFTLLINPVLNDFK